MVTVDDSNMIIRVSMTSWEPSMGYKIEKEYTSLAYVLLVLFIGIIMGLLILLDHFCHHHHPNYSTDLEKGNLSNRFDTNHSGGSPPTTAPKIQRTSTDIQRP
jgi:hypothetical protein